MYELFPCKLVSNIFSNMLLFDLLNICSSQVSHLDSVTRDVQFVEVLKKIQAKAKLVRIGSIPLTELGKSKSYLLNSEPLG